MRSTRSLQRPRGPRRRGRKAQRTRYLPDNIYDAIRLFKASRYAQELLGADVHEKYAELKLAAAERCPKALGSRVKRSEIQFHHEVTNQYSGTVLTAATTVGTTQAPSHGGRGLLCAPVPLC